LDLSCREKASYRDSALPAECTEPPHDEG
jgi:hypothetical protein